MDTLHRYGERRTTVPTFPNARPATTATDYPIGTVVVDAEEDFDWDAPVRGTTRSVEHMTRLDAFQDLVLSHGAPPAYLVTQPVLEDARITAALAAARSRDECDVGMQMHTWVTPPYDPEGCGSGDPRYSYAGNLPPDLERRKLIAQGALFRQRLGFAPTIYRAGRYGMGRATPRMLEGLGFEIDCSVAPRTDFTEAGGPDYTAFGNDPFWFGESRRLLEVPLCRDLVGWGRDFAGPLYEAGGRGVAGMLRVRTLLSSTRCVERLTLSPEANDGDALKRLADGMRRRGATVFPVSLHSSSLAPGRNPYVRTAADQKVIRERLAALMAHLAAIGVRFRRLSEVPALLASETAEAAA